MELSFGVWIVPIRRSNQMPHAPQKAGRHLSRFPKVRQVTDGDHRYSRIAADPHVRSRILRFTQRQYGGSSIAHLCGGLPPQRTAMLVGGNAQPTKRPIYDRFVAGVLEYDRRKARMQWMHAEAIEYAYDQIGLSLAMKEAALLLFQILQDSYAWRYRRVPVDVYLRFVKKNSAQLLEHEIESARCPKSLHRWLTSSSWWWPPSFRWLSSVA